MTASVAADAVPTWLMIALSVGCVVLLRGVWLSIASREIHPSIYGSIWARRPIALRWYHWPYLILTSLLGIAGLVFQTWLLVDRFGA